MTKESVVFFKDQIVNFYPNEIEDISSLESDRVWDVFTNTSKRFYKKTSTLKENKLKEQGVEFLENILTKEDVLELKQEWEEHFIPMKISRDSENIELLKKDQKEYSVVNYQIPIRSVQIASKAIIKTLSPDITSKIEDYLESHFAISHVLFAEAFPDEEPITSFRWHCDGGPRSQTHIMVYLDDYEETGGRTEFLSYDDSAKIYNSGYNPSNASDRLLDITDIDPSVTIIRPSPKAGDLIVFNATRIFHCGIHPTKKSRKVLFIILHADFAPWTETAAHRNIFSYPTGRHISGENPFLNYLREV